MNFKTTLVLTLLAAVVAGYFVFVERGTISPRERARDVATRSQEEGAALFDANPVVPNDVARVRIERDGKTVTLEREGEQWQQIEPVRFPLDGTHVNDLASAVAELRYLDRFAPAPPGTADANSLPTREAAGLASPRATLTLEHGDETTTIHLGDRSLGNNGYLALEDDERIYIANDTLHDQLLDNTVSDWRQRTFDSPEATATDRVVLDRSRAERVELSRHDGQWFMNTDHTERASADAVKRLVNAVSGARIEAFVSDQPETLSRYGLAEPRLTCILHTPAVSSDDNDDTPSANGNDEAASNDGATYTLRIGNATDLSNEQYFATWSVGDERSPVVFTLTRSDIEPFEANVDDLRDPHLIMTEAREIKAIEVTRPNQPALHLVRDVNQGFVFGAPENNAEAAPATNYGVDYDAATSLLQALAEAEATDYRTGFAPDSEPHATIQITQRGSGLTETLRLYEQEPSAAASEDEPAYLAVREGEPVAYQISREALADLFKPRLAFRNRDVLELQEADIAQITLQRDDDVTFTFQRAQSSSDAPSDDEPTWTLQGEDTFESDMFDALLDALSPLRAERWITTDGAAPAEPGEGWCTLTIEQREGSPQVLHVDPQTRRTILEGIEASFVLPQPVVDRLAGEYRERTVLNVSQSQIDSVTVRDGHDEDNGTTGEAVEIYRDTDDRYVTADGQSVDQSKAGRFFDALAGLAVDRYTSAAREALPAPRRHITVDVQNGQSHEVTIHASDDGRWQRLATVDGRLVRLKSNDYDHLTAALVNGEGTGE